VSGVKSQSSGRRPACPKCGSGVERISRRWIDRVMSSFLPSRRYRCRSIACKWEGNLRNALYELPPSDTEKRYERRIDWD
jgi:hypothetical protein